MKVVTLPSSLSKETLPPNDSVMRLITANLKPWPLDLVVNIGVNNFPFRASGLPTPVSLTVKIVSLASLKASIVIFPSGADCYKRVKTCVKETSSIHRVGSGLVIIFSDFRHLNSFSQKVITFTIFLKWMELLQNVCVKALLSFSTKQCAPFNIFDNYRIMNYEKQIGSKPF